MTAFGGFLTDAVLLLARPKCFKIERENIFVLCLVKQGTLQVKNMKIGSGVWVVWQSEKV